MDIDIVFPVHQIHSMIYSAENLALEILVLFMLEN